MEVIRFDTDKTRREPKGAAGDDDDDDDDYSLTRFPEFLSFPKRAMWCGRRWYPMVWRLVSHRAVLFATEAEHGQTNSCTGDYWKTRPVEDVNSICDALTKHLLPEYMHMRGSQRQRAYIDPATNHSRGCP